LRNPDDMVGGDLWIVLRPLTASMATLALNSGLWLRRLLNSFGEGCA